MKSLDVRGMACPMPVVSVKRALESAEGGVRVLLDDGAPRENVTRFATGRGYTVTEEAVEGGFALAITGGEQQPAEPAAAKEGPVVMLVGADRLGEGPEELGRLLMKNYIITLLDLDKLPDRIFFVNSGVLLTVEGSEVLEALEALGNRGVEVLSCGVCLDYFKKREQLAAGAVTNMFTIAESMMKAGNVVRL
ncbi:sulfurtransferase-like selenium metabolism protein YedF [Geomonas sp. Red32]|uniref:sulfurtransferase-like selenium metabolism protein YedF n=1 Tax=Geomonas sp. Red32 TaxID=2912856 RepID=UPI00202CE00F|nr:sulfurtransferase-like selenium metabolism protein YedF [Geomonas sp. Red32]MCM0084058.1 sulfurtransferase-like selenium metabolism protein YedF [Geomonas sp. Red32]